VKAPGGGGSERRGGGRLTAALQRDAWTAQNPPKPSKNRLGGSRKGAAARPNQPRATHGDDVKGDVHAGQGGEDVAEEDHAVGLERAPGLQGHLDLRARRGGGGGGGGGVGECRR